MDSTFFLESKAVVAKTNILDAMSVVEDPRIYLTKAHDLQYILVFSVLAVLCSADEWEDIELLGKIRLSWLRKFIKLKDGVPSHKAVIRVFRMIKPYPFQEAFYHRWKTWTLVATDSMLSRSMENSFDDRKTRIRSKTCRTVLLHGFLQIGLFSAASLSMRNPTRCRQSPNY